MGILINLIFSALKTGVNVLVILLSSRYLSLPDFQQMLYIRKTSPIIGSFLQLGSSQSTMINMPRSSVDEDLAWFRISLWHILLSIISFVLLYLTAYRYIGVMLLIASFSISIDYIIRPLFLARLQLFLSNTLEILNIGGIIIFLIIIGKRDIHSIIVLASTINILILGNIFLYKYYLISRTQNAKGVSYLKIIDNIRFGMPRSIVGILELGLTSFPIAIIGAAASAEFNIASTFARFSLVFVLPVMEIINIKLNKNITKFGIVKISNSFSEFLPVIILVSFFIAQSMYIFCQLILHSWLGKRYNLEILEVSHVMCLSIPGMIIINATRGFIDSIYKKPLSLYVISLGLILCLVSTLFLKGGLMNITYSVSLIYFIIGFTAIIVISKMKHIRDVLLYLSISIIFLALTSQAAYYMVISSVTTLTVALVIAVSQWRNL